MTRTASTTDHTVIRNWVEARGGQPSRVTAAGSGDRGGVLRIDFDPPDDGLEPIDWDEFFEIFEDRCLAFLHQDISADGQPSLFNKFVNREGS